MTDIAGGTEDVQETESEAQALAQILAWSEEWPDWQRDALRRLCAKEALDDEDLDELTAMCLNKGTGSVPLAADHLPDPKSVATVVTLRGIHSVQHVNALKEGEHLTFDKSGLTIVYGDNGSGKSGYARILKKVCRARIPKGDDRILPNIYASTSGPQQALVEFTADGQNRSENWKAGYASGALLSSVSVFDSRTANVHVDAVNDVAYTPFPMKVLERLAAACQAAKDRINAEVRAVEAQTPATIAKPECHPHTRVGKLIEALDGNTKEQDVRDLATVTNKEKARLETLKTDLGTEPARLARQLDALKQQLSDTADATARLQRAVAADRAKRLQDLYGAYQTAREAAGAAAGDLFAKEPLPHVGSDVWRTLWEAARSYSEQQAYPGQPFPVTGETARCVLCQQQLGAEAGERLVRFERFVKNETKRREEQAREAYQTAREKMEASGITVADIRTAAALLRDRLGDEDAAEHVRTALLTAKWRLRAILRGHTRGDAAGPYPDIAPWPSDAIAGHIAAISQRIAALRAEDESEERKQMRAEYEELTDRLWLSMIQEDVVAEIGRRRKRAALAEGLKDTATNRITARSGEIAEQLVTNALRAQFSREIDKFGVAGLAIELRKEKSSYGVPRFRVSLMRKPDAHAGEILSEGEHRCVALAAFLAELATTQGRSAIVFDDPVSSLDHMHREAVAERLADEGRHRQIIVFTHDIAFLFLLDQACREKGTHAGYRCVTRSEDYAGFCQPDPPARAQPIEKVIEGMQKQLENEKIRYEKGDHAGWERTVDMLQKRLRSTWERAVEEAVGPVIKRLSNKVETKGLSKVTALTLADCTAMRQAYGRCSNLLHSSADALNPPLPKPGVVQDEITALRNWIADIKQRQEKIEWLQ